MIVNFRKEIWTPFTNEKWSDDDEYAVSNYGRIKKKKVYDENWRLSPVSLVSGYESFGIVKKGKLSKSSYYVHKAVAILYAEKREDQNFVIHLDFDKLNNQASNLKWVNKTEMFLHHKKNPKKIARIGKVTSSKLSEGRVRMIKKKVLDPNRRTRMRLIAKQFGISEMQLYRIKSGENWSHVKID
ncbi:MAG: HNH endonuclease [Flavobacteriaceae bacterium]|nr:HNH endonuclease [Flavobacteriaceae bacterium]